MRKTYDPKVQLNSCSKPHWISIPSNIMIPVSDFVHVVSSYYTSKADNKPDAKKKCDYDTLAKWKIQPKHNGNWKQHYAEIV